MLLRWITEWWHARQRAVDLDVLWPVCRANAHDMAHAHAAFLLHALNDRAWLCLGEDRVIAIVSELR